MEKFHHLEKPFVVMTIAILFPFLLFAYYGIGAVGDMLLLGGAVVCLASAIKYGLSALPLKKPAYALYMLSAILYVIVWDSAYPAKILLLLHKSALESAIQNHDGNLFYEGDETPLSHNSGILRLQSVRKGPYGSIGVRINSRTSNFRGFVKLALIHDSSTTWYNPHYLRYLGDGWAYVEED